MPENFESNVLQRFNYGYTIVGSYIIINGGKYYNKLSLPKFLNDIIIYNMDNNTLS